MREGSDLDIVGNVSPSLGEIFDSLCSFTKYEETTSERLLQRSTSTWT